MSLAVTDQPHLRRAVLTGGEHDGHGEQKEGAEAGALRQRRQRQPEEQRAERRQQQRRRVRQRHVVRREASDAKRQHQLLELP